MQHYIGLDVSQAETYICIVDENGKKLWEGKCDSTPEAIGEIIKREASAVEKIGLETGNLSTYLWHGLNDMGLPVVCIDAYHAHGVLKLQMNKTEERRRRPEETVSQPVSPLRGSLFVALGARAHAHA